MYEEYVPFRTVANGGTEGKKKRKRKKRDKRHVSSDTEPSSELSHCEGVGCGKMCRWVKQLFIRGDNVVMVTGAQGSGKSS